MYTQYFLKFATQEEFHEVFTELGWYGQVGVSDGEPRYGFTMDGHEGSIDEVGIIVDTPGMYDDVTGEEVTPPTYVDGWHVNIVIKSELPEQLQAFVVTPTTPSRVFAGF